MNKIPFIFIKNANIYLSVLILLNFTKSNVNLKKLARSQIIIPHAKMNLIHTKSLVKPTVHTNCLSNDTACFITH